MILRYFLEMTPDDFRRLALSFPEAAEHAHMHHPDFRVRGKIFATLGYPHDNWAMVKLPPEYRGGESQTAAPTLGAGQ